MVVSGLLPGKSTEQVELVPFSFFGAFFMCFKFVVLTYLSQAELATLLGCLEAAYTTLEMRETSKEKAAGAALNLK